jgi:hypothetical protein
MFHPAVDTVLTVTLPGEILRAPVVKLWDDDTVIVELTGVPLNPGKTHAYRKGDLVPVQRCRGALGESWQAIDERRLYGRPVPGEEPPMPPPKKKEAAVPRRNKNVAKSQKRKPVVKKGKKRALGRK